MESNTRPGGPTRRAFLGAGAAAAATVALAACSSSNDAGQSSSTTTGSSTGAAPTGSATTGGSSGAPSSSGGTAKRGGTFRVAPKTFAEAPSCDPHLPNGSYSINSALFSALIEVDHQGKWNLAMAEQFEPEDNNPSQWIIRLKDGLEWHNGKTIDIDDVIYTIKRITDPKAPKASANLLAPIDLNNMQKMDSRTLRLKLKTPHSLLSHGFGRNFSSIVPVDFDPNKPVGCGPFKYSSYTVKQRLVGTRFENYWRGSGMPYLDQLELVGFSSTTAALNALLSGQIDGLDWLLPSQLTQVKQRPNLVVLESESGTIQQVSMNCRKGAPFEDVRVRKAFKLMLDRNQLVNTVYAGHGKVGNDVGVFPQWDEACDPNLPEIKQDLDQAKALLKEAGKENMTVKLRVGELITGMTAAAQVIQQQAKQIGVTIDLDVVNDVTTFYTDAYYAADMQIDWTNTIEMRSGVDYYWTTTAGYNAAGYSNPDVDNLAKEAYAHIGEGYITPMRKMSQILHDEGPWLVWGHSNQLDVHTDKFTGPQADAMGTGFNGNYWEEISLA